MSTRTDWLDAGLRLLAEGGESALRIDRVAPLVGRSKGSFHHHFDGAADYRRALLAHYEQLAVDGLDSAIAELGDAPPRAVFAALTERLHGTAGSLWNPELETAVRGWSFFDDEARAVQERVDRTRYDRMLTQWRRITTDDAYARTAALLPFLVAVGASVALPTPTVGQLHDVYALLTEFLAVPSIPGTTD